MSVNVLHAVCFVALVTSCSDDAESDTSSKAMSDGKDEVSPSKPKSNDTTSEDNVWKFVVTAEGQTKNHTVSGALAAVTFSKTKTESEISAQFRVESTSATQHILALLTWQFDGDLRELVPLTASDATDNFKGVLLSYPKADGTQWLCNRGTPRYGELYPQQGTFTINVESAELRTEQTNLLRYVIHGTAYAECPGGGDKPGAGTVSYQITF